MATRNLARTVIEVGRSPRSKGGRKRLRRAERREARSFCYDADTQDDLGDLAPAPRTRRKDYSFEQGDKLGPALRWMNSRVGRRWDDVFSELSTKFRGRGIALSHVVDTHMLDWVDYRKEGEAARWGALYRFVVDDDGLLQHNPAYQDWRSKRVRWTRPDPAVSVWAADRKVIVHGDRCFWTAPDRWERYSAWDPSKPTVSFESHRQGEEFSKEDYAYWAKLSERDRKEVIWA